MLKKFVSSLLVLSLFMVGCGKKEESGDVMDEDLPQAQECASIADELVKELELDTTCEEAKERVMYGMFFNTSADDPENVITDGKVYLSKEGKSDTIGVFKTTDMDKTLADLQDYLDTQKENSEMYSPEEVFKISNAVVETDDSNMLVVLIVCDNIEEAKNLAKQVLK